MGHSSMIGMGIALAQPMRIVAVLDGDGACLMHTGALAVMASRHPGNVVHVMFNNRAHESVGGMPTASCVVNWCGIALASGYETAVRVENEDALGAAVKDAVASEGPSFIEVVIDTSSRADLGRPTTSAHDNGRAFQAFLLGDEAGE